MASWKDELKEEVILANITFGSSSDMRGIVECTRKLGKQLYKGGVTCGSSNGAR